MLKEESSQTSRFLKNNIVKIIDEKGNFYGTAFFINVNDKIYGVTCHHCIYKLNTITIEKKSKTHLLKWNEKYSDMSKDIAILDRDGDCPIEPLNYNLEAMPKLPVNVYGYSAKSLDEFSDGKFGGKSELDEDSIPFSWNEEISKGKKLYQNQWNKKPKINVNVFEIKGEFEKGFSGAPVYYLGNNNIVGMFIAKDEMSGYVLPIQTILDRFSIGSLGYTTGNQDNSSYLREGNQFHSKKNFQSAISCYDKIIYDANYYYAIFAKALSLRKLGFIKKKQLLCSSSRLV